jgi:hypothetical protein
MITPMVYTGPDVFKPAGASWYKEGVHELSTYNQSISDQYLGYCRCGEWFCNISTWSDPPAEIVSAMETEYAKHLATINETAAQDAHP